MPDNQIPAAQPEAGAEPAEFNFAKPAAENPRIKRRSLKTKPAGLIKPAGTLSAARELEREAPPLSAEQNQAVKPQTPDAEKTMAAQVKPAGKVTATPVAPARTIPSAGTTISSSPASGSSTPKTAATPASSPTTSPHGTRPATLYYSSQPRKDKEATPSPMKTIPTAAPAASSSTTTLPSSVTRTAAASTRPAPQVDYRANVERQSREQKSVGNILGYVVYALIGFFVLSAALAGYGSYVIFQRLHDQSQTVSDLDARYTAVNKDLNAKLATTQDALTQTQAQVTRQQDLILRQQEELNRLIAATNDNVKALTAEKQARTQETTTLRGRVRDLENRPTYQH